MKKLILGLVALSFLGTGAAFAMKHEGPAAEKLAAACKGKKAGDKVKVDGKEMTCPKTDDKKK
ncbi:hypothetical protein SVA_3672 [Sulfurifustis variabilis]|uniref:Phosphate starvation-inducible protein PsiF n=1 Tax=Sulfurifustis variabilis TaxID=1675686 RepID=A0A1C7AFQ4_9GAMM|nr:hypothetical protein [Sulfurifustis variabilis]BAU50208.1 hypothetical protein SVA_3672 [Sulfurifustis variabilis]